MIPLRDDNPTVLKPAITATIILVNVLVFPYQISLRLTDPRLFERFIFQTGMVPASLLYAHIPGTAGGF
jgi:hypothetical protein